MEGIGGSGSSGISRINVLFRLVNFIGCLRWGHVYFFAAIRKRAFIRIHVKPRFGEIRVGLIAVHVMLVFGQPVNSFHPSLLALNIVLVLVRVFSQNVLDECWILLEYPSVVKVHGPANCVQHFVIHFIKLLFFLFHCIH